MGAEPVSRARVVSTQNGIRSKEKKSGGYVLGSARFPGEESTFWNLRSRRNPETGLILARMSFLLVTTVSTFRKGFMPAVEAGGPRPNKKWPKKLKWAASQEAVTIPWLSAHSIRKGIGGDTYILNLTQPLSRASCRMKNSFLPLAAMCARALTLSLPEC